MKLDAFATLDAVLRHGSLAAAAIERNLTPSAVSMQMKQLEAYLGQPLFDRSGQQVRPTPLAHEVAKTTRGALAGLEGLRKHRSVAVEGVVRLGILDSMLPVLLPEAMRHARERHPALHIRPVRGRSTGLTDAVKSGTLDIALVARPARGGSVRLHWRTLSRNELVLVAPPKATETSLPALFRKYEWIRYQRDTVTGAMATRFVNARIPDKRGSMEFDSAAAIVAMVSAGLGISVLHLAEPRMRQTYPVRIVPLGAGAPTVEMALVCRKEDSESRLLAALHEAMAEAIAVAAQGAGHTSPHGAP